MGVSLKMRKNIFAVFMFLLVGLIAASAAVSAGAVSIEKVKIDNFELASGQRLDVEARDTIEIEVWINASLDKDDVQVSARLNGYEYGDIQDKTELFDVEAGNFYKKRVKLNIPHDIDASETYTLRIEVSDPDDEVEQTFSLHIDERRHDIDIFRTFISPSTTVEAGSTFVVTAYVENLGSKKEDRVIVSATIPQLGVVAQSFTRDDLITRLQEEAGNFADDENEDSSQVDLLLRVPADAPEGNYNVEITAEYNRGHDFVTTTRQIFVKGKAAARRADTLISVDSSSRVLTADAETSYKIVFANIGSERGVYSISVDGEETFADARIDPSFVTVMPDGMAEAKVYLKAKSDARPGNYNFVVRVSSGRDMVQEISLQAKVDGKVTAGKADVTGLRQALIIIAAVLVIVLVILLLVLLYKKVGENQGGSYQAAPMVQQHGNKPEAPSNTAEAQSYYYYPRK
jgi:uncharacterized membrane protein